jgi:hypothetical protein
MKHDPKATANALAVVGGVLYLICAILTLISTEIYLSIMGTWAHSLDMKALPQKTPDLGTLVIGLITFVLAAWVTGYAFAVCYNYFAKKI